MNIKIVKADIKYFDSCVEILQNSNLGKAYFTSKEKVMSMLVFALSDQSLYVAVDDKMCCLGFIYYMSKGMFGSYPYLHIVAVKEECRGQGIGKLLISYFEQHASDYSTTKYFLTVDDFNPMAKKLYEKLGYKCVGELPDFYKEGITCYLMLKDNKV